MSRIDGKALGAAAQLDPTGQMYNRLLDGRVSQVDMQQAQAIYQNVMNSPPPMMSDGYGRVYQDPLQTMQWNATVDMAQHLYSRVSSQFQRQNPYETQMETAKDTGQGWNPNYNTGPVFTNTVPVFTPPFNPNAQPYLSNYPQITGPVVYGPQYNPMQYPNQYPVQYPYGGYGYGRPSVGQVVAGALVTAGMFELIRRMGR